MRQEEIVALFDEQAGKYDAQWMKTAAIKQCLHVLLDSMFADLPADATVLIVGTGTGAELAHLASRNPAWSFTVVEPAAGMLSLCRERAEREGFANRCHFHAGYIESLPATALHDAATCILVSQFIVDQRARVDLFREIARRLKPGAVLASADLAADVRSTEYAVLLRAWVGMMVAMDFSQEDIDRVRNSYTTDVAVLPATDIAALIVSAGFDTPVQFFQAGLIAAWLFRRRHPSS